jgi:hypothetical protein
VLGGCKEKVLFSHKAHSKQGIDCEQCHPVVQGYALPGMPGIEACSVCHNLTQDVALKEKHSGKMYEKECTACHRSSLFTKTRRRVHLEPSDLKFSHAIHKESKIDCDTCHGDIAHSITVDGKHIAKMEICLDCHRRAEPEIKCQKCHQRLAADTPPEGHKKNWDVYHGSFVRRDSDRTCLWCHKRADCSECHQNQAPEDHTNHWRQRGHGVAAGIDRDRCIVCHRTDICMRCHQEVSPQDHIAGWDSPRNLHCLRCHFTLQSQGCYTCHKAAPSHDQADEMPKDKPTPLTHATATDCRTCHSPLSHPDDGGNCRNCHGLE